MIRSTSSRLARSLFVTVPSSILLLACAAQPTDELAGDDGDETLDGKADASTPGGTYTYFELSTDVRKCAAPACGGFFVERLNRSTTKCVDGSYQDRCYAPELDLSEADLPDGAFEKLVDAAGRSIGEGVHAIVRGRFAPTNATQMPSLGRFVVTEVWLSQSDSVASGVFAKVMDNGLRCIAAPCPSMVEKALNSSRKANIAEVDYSEAGLGDRVLEAVGTDLFTPHGVIVAGNRFTVEIDGRTGKGRTATAVFRRLGAEVSEPCFVGGCSGQVCSDQAGVITTCEWRPEYACYADATCERQSDGTCGWTETPELATCLGN